MNFDILFAIIFYLLLIIFYLKNKKKFEIQGGIFALYRTKLGLKLMDKIAKKFPKSLNFIGYISIVVGFAGMILILYTLIQGTYKLVLGYLGIIPQSPPVIAPVLPGISVQGLPVLSFWHWIIAIFIVAVIHEFAHGVYSRLAKVKIKSSGFAFLGPILAAFVEPDEEELKKVGTRKNLAMVSAGPFINIVLAFIVILFFNFLFVPLQSGLLSVDGVKLVNVETNSPADIAGMKAGLIIKDINGIPLNSQNDLVNEIQKSKQSDVLKINTDKGNYYVKPDFSQNKPKIGISVENNLVVKRGPQFLLPIISWLNMLFFWLWVISLGIGLFNLLPLGPIDGGRLLYSGLLGITTIKRSKKIFGFVTFLSAFLIFINLIPWLIKLFKFFIQLIF